MAQLNKRRPVWAKASAKQKRIAKSLTCHHLVPKSRGGSAGSRNILRLAWEKHQSWHKLFKNKTIVEVLELLLQEARFEKKPFDSKRFRLVRWDKLQAWYCLFKKKSSTEALGLLVKMIWLKGYYSLSCTYVQELGKLKGEKLELTG